MFFRVLGPLEIEDGGTERITLPGERLRALLVALLLQPGAVVPETILVEALWGEEPPDRPANALHQTVRRLRSRLGPLGDVVRTRPPGYQLAIDAAAIDAERFEAGFRAARRLAQQDAAGAVVLLDEAVNLWRGPAYAEFADGFARAPATRLEELRLAAAEERAALLLRSGAVVEAIAAARELAARDPLRDRPVEVLMRALAEDRRAADALEAYRRHRDRLADELGLDPAPGLQELQDRVLRGDLPAEAPAPAARTRKTPGLPWRHSQMLGREQELGLLQDCLREHPLVTLVGPGGVGKTRLALEAAHELAARGTVVWWADLSAVPRRRLIDALADATGVEVPRGADPAAALTGVLVAHCGILCLDNAETELEALAPLVERLVAAAPHLTLLATSRERLAAAQEHVHLLAPLPLPSGADRDNPAVRLFVNRAPGLEPNRLADTDVYLIAEICRRLDGLPLAIELGAARAPTLGLKDFSSRIRHGLDLLSGGRRTAADRHRSLRVVVDWSHGLLTGDEARLFARLGVFPSTFTLDQAEGVCADGLLPGATVGPVLARLVEQSLVQAGEGSFWLLETLRAYALERLGPEALSVRARHAADTAGRLTTLSADLWGPNEPAAVTAITALIPDLHAAWAHAAEHDAPLAVRLAADVLDYAYNRQRMDLMEWGLTVARWQIEHPRLADALSAGAAAAGAAGRLKEARELAARGIAAAGGEHDPRAARSMDQYACIDMFEGRTADALAHYRKAAALHAAAGETVLAHIFEVSTAQVMSYAGPDAVAQAALPLPMWLERARADGNASGLAWTWFVLGEALSDVDPERALAAYAAAVERGTPANSRLFVTLARSAMLRLAASDASPDQALAEFGRVVDQWEQLGNDIAQWWVLINLVVLLARLESARDAALLAGAALASLHRYPTLARETGRVLEAVDAVRPRLGQAATEAAMADGATLSLSEAVAAARRAITHASNNVEGSSQEEQGPPVTSPLVV